MMYKWHDCNDVEMVDGLEQIICPHMRENLLQLFIREEETNQNDTNDDSDLNGIANMAKLAGEHVPKVANAGLDAVGFGKKGVRANSWASRAQSATGSVKSGSMFSKAQSTGATGGFGLGLAAVATAVAAAVGTGIFLWKKASENSEREEERKARAEIKLIQREMELRRIGETLICEQCKRVREEERRRRR